MHLSSTLLQWQSTAASSEANSSKSQTMNKCHSAAKTGKLLAVGHSPSPALQELQKNLIQLATRNKKKSSVCEISKSFIQFCQESSYKHEQVLKATFRLSKISKISGQVILNTNTLDSIPSASSASRKSSVCTSRQG